MGSKSYKLKRAVRKAGKWGGAGLTVLLVGAWIGSGWWRVSWMGPTTIRASIESGMCFIADDDAVKGMIPYGIWQASPTGGPFRWWFRTVSLPGFRVVHIPLWLPALLSLLATAAAWRADAKHLRRAREGLCPECGYDRAGLAAGAVCPECGAAGGAASA